MSTQQQQRSPLTTHWRQVHRRLNPHLLYAEDLLSHGLREIDLEIVDSGVEKVAQMDGKRKTSKEMPWLAFNGAKKRFALNATNCKAMQSLAATGIVEHWRGWIKLVVVETEYQDQSSGKREKTDALRIAPKRPRPYEPDRERHAQLAAQAAANLEARKGEIGQEIADLEQERTRLGADAPQPDEPRGWNGELTEDEKRQIAEEEAKRHG